ncbi:MAG: alpha-galactosidase [Candidatus Acidiferrum sp.]
MMRCSSWLLKIFACLLLALGGQTLLAEDSIHYVAAAHLFVLQSGSVTYVLGVNESGMLQSVYWGPRLWREADLVAPRAHAGWASFELSPGVTPQEYAGWGSGLAVEPGLKVTFPDGNRDLALRYADHSITKDSLEITLKDIERPLFVHLKYTVYPETGMIGRQARIENRSTTPVTLESAQSATWYLPTGDGYRLRYLTGRWASEWHLQEEPINDGSEKVLESRRGSTSHGNNPWFAIDHSSDLDEEHGSVWFGALAWSGSWRITVEQPAGQQVRVTGGYNSFDFAYRLAAGDSLSTPVFYAGYAEHGIGEASRLMHQCERTHILPNGSGMRTRPILYNSWEATEFNVDEPGQVALAEKAASLGVERFVMDDGWFGRRNDDHAGLGDWQVNPKKFPNGLKPLISRVKSLGMDFGLWFEPEMVNPDSDLYRQHPDWAMHFEGRPRTEARNQLILNLARDDVKEYIFQELDKMLTDNDIAFVKWDYNRYFTEPGWPEAPAEEQKKIWVRYTQNLYEILDRLRKKHPHLEIETCSGGGGRVDLGILQRTEEVWTSDNTEAFDRLTIQSGFSYAHTPHVMMAWVTDVPNMNGRSVPLKYRFLMAMQGSLGIGSNLNHWKPEEFEEARKLVQYYKSVRATVQNGRLYRLAAAQQNFAANEYVAGDGSQAVVFGFLHSQQFRRTPAPLELRGLDEGAVYRVHRYGDTDDQSKSLSGAYLMHHGLDFNLKGDYDSASVLLERVSDKH